MTAQQGYCKSDAGENKLICPGECVTLGGEVPGSDTSAMAVSIKYRWSPATGLNNSALGNPSACPTSKTTYTLHIYAINPQNDTICIASSITTVDIKSSCYNDTGIRTEEFIVIEEGPNATKLLVDDLIYSTENNTRKFFNYLNNPEDK